MSSHHQVCVKVKPSAKKTEITGFEEDVFLVSIAAQPENNKANLELVKFLSKLAKKKLNIVNGLTSKTKTLRVAHHGLKI